MKLGGLSLKDLRRSYGKVAEEFENASLDMMSVVAEDEADINEIFKRLNKSKQLTGAEVRNAVSGPVSDLIRVIASHEFFVENIKFSIKRAADLNAAAKLLIFEYNEKPVATKKSNLDEFAISDIKRERLELSGRRVLDTLSSMTSIFIPRDQLLVSAGIVPVYYWFIREMNEEHYWRVREALTSFEAARKENRERQKEKDGENLDNSLSRFDTLNRSTNDQQSHIGRVQILQSFFKNLYVLKKINSRN